MFKAFVFSTVISVVNSVVYILWYIRVLISLSINTEIKNIGVVLTFLFLISCGDEGIILDDKNNYPNKALTAPTVSLTPCPNFLWKNASQMRLIRNGKLKVGINSDIIAETESYLIDIHEVTIDEYNYFVEMAGYVSETNIPETSWQEINNPVEVTWNDANAYATWVGKRLPNEIEWEKAARGGHEQKQFPWGNNEPTNLIEFIADENELWIPNPETKFPDWIEVNSQKSVHVGSDEYLAALAAEGNFYYWSENENPFLAKPGRDPIPMGLLLHYLAPVMSFEPNGYGLFDMIGNASEWCSNPYSDNSLLFLSEGIELPNTQDVYPVRDSVKRHLGRSSEANETIHVGNRVGRHRDYKSGFRCVLDVGGNLTIQ